MVRNDGNSEYAAGPGGPARWPNGKSRRLSPGEAARVARIRRKEDVPDPASPRIQRRGVVTEEGQVQVAGAFEPDVRAIGRIRARTNRYSDTDGVNEKGSGLGRDRRGGIRRGRNA